MGAILFSAPFKGKWTASVMSKYVPVATNE